MFMLLCHFSVLFVLVVYVEVVPEPNIVSVRIKAFRDDPQMARAY